MNTQQQPIYVSTLNYNNNYNQNKKYLLVDSRCRADYFNRPIYYFRNFSALFSSKLHI